MDFHTLSRRDLQALCKKNHIPANVTNVAMANALQALQMVEGIEELLQSPKTIQRTGSHKPVGPAEDQASSVPRSRRVTARTPAALNLVDEEEKKKDVAETPKVPNTRRRAGQKDEGNEIVETMRKPTRTSVVRGVEAQKEEKVVGATTGRRTRGTVKKEVDLMSGGVKRSSRARGITMASLAKEELEEGKETGEVVVETTEEKVDDKAEELEEQKVGDKAEEQEEEKVDDEAEQVDDTAEEQEKIDDKADEVEEEKVETGEVVVETHEEKDHNKAEEQEEEKVDKVDDKAEEQEKFVDKAGEQEEEEEKVDDKAKQVEDKAAGARDIVDQQNVICYEKMAVETKNEEMTDDVAEKETNDIMEEGEIKSSDQTYYHDLIMSEDGDFVDQMSDLQSQEMVEEASKEDKLDDKAEQEEEEIDVQVEHEKEETDDHADEKPEERDVQVELEEEKIDYQAGEKLEDKQEQEEEQIDDQIGEKLEDKQEQVELEEEKINYQAGEKLEDKQEQEEEQIDDQIEQVEEREMEDTVEEEIKSLEGNTCNDLIMSVDEESVDQKNDIKYEEMAAVMAMQEEKLEEEEEENEMDDIVEEEIQSLENSSAIVISHVEEREECSEFVEEAAIINENSPIRCLITSENVVVEESGKESGNIQIGELIDNLSDLNLSLKEDMRDLITSDQTSSNEEDENVKRSSGETGNIQIGELVDNLLDLNLGFKEETKAGDDGVPRGENNNKENDWVGKSKAQKNNYEDMSLRKLKAAYKEVVVAMNKGEEKRAALKIIDENCS